MTESQGMGVGSGGGGGGGGGLPQALINSIRRLWAYMQHTSIDSVERNTGTLLVDPGPDVGEEISRLRADTNNCYAKPCGKRDAYFICVCSFRPNMRAVVCYWF